MPADLKYRRVLLKISGEALMGEREYGQDPAVVARIAKEVKQVHGLGVEVCLVIGGGNIFRGLGCRWPASPAVGPEDVPSASTTGRRLRTCGAESLRNLAP